MTVETVMFSLLRREVCDGTIGEEVKNALSDEMLKAVYALAKKHDLAHIVGNALSKLGLLGSDDISQKFNQITMRAVYRYVGLNYEYQQICKVFQEAQIPFVPLKGSVLRDYYPEPWQRTSCDIDILVREQTLDAATQVLVDKLEYRTGEKGGHDISLFSPSGIHLELHYTTLEDAQVVRSRKVLERFWDVAEPCKENEFCLAVPDEMFYFYHIAHMAKHVEIGGCGIRPFLDLWILNHRVKFDKKKRDMLLREGGLMKFAEAAQTLTETWFSGMSPDPCSQRFEEFILTGGVYGSLRKQIIVQQTMKGSKFRYALERVVLPYDIIKHYYPILQKYRWLTPIYQVVRWFKLLFEGGVKRSLQELKVNATVSKQEIESTEDMLKYLGL